MTRRRTLVDKAGAGSRICPTCNAQPTSPCLTPKGLPFSSKQWGTVHRRRCLVPAPLSHFAVTVAGHGHVRNAKHGSSALCGIAVTLEWVDKVRVSCSECYGARAYLLEAPGRTLPGGALLPLEGGVPEDTTT